MVRFLSAEWLDQLAETAAASDHLRRASTGTSVVVRQVVTGGPDGDIDYVVRLDHGTVSVSPGAEGPADVEITEDYATATAISQGLLTPAAAFAAGRLKIGGRVGLLVEHAPAFAALGGVFAASRAATTY
ncbi:MAG: SCP2 sterol-binding domain-containing protein [Actinomycetota bacterium]|nr:SCP2 sterol-binding domain-containing protein [Actinomycetota bacterium]